MERFSMIRRSILLMVLLGPSIALADPVGVSGASVYVTKSDCMALVRHHPSADATYQPGTDVHGKYVAPADLPGSNAGITLPDKVQFDLKINPMNYAQGQQNAVSGKYANTALTVAHISVDLKTGQTLLNGKPLDGEQDQYILDACYKAGFR
jgi:hypothetical protein